MGRDHPRRLPFWAAVTSLTAHWLEAVTHRARDKDGASRAWKDWGWPVLGQDSPLTPSLPRSLSLHLTVGSPGACDVCWGGAGQPGSHSAVSVFLNSVSLYSLQMHVSKS